MKTELGIRPGSHLIHLSRQRHIGPEKPGSIHQEMRMLATLRPLLIPLTMVLFLSLSDCIRSGTDIVEDELRPDPTPTSTPEPTATPTPESSPESSTRSTPSPTPTPEPEPESTLQPVPDLTEREIETFLLRSSDLSPAWSTVDVSEPFTTAPGAEDTDSVLVSAFFQQSEVGPYLGHLLLYTDSAQDARVVFNAIESELDSADILDGITEQVRSWETEPSPFEQYGDETFAYKAIGDTGLIPVEADMVATRQGQFVSLVIHAELMMVDSSETETFVETTVSRLPDSNGSASGFMQSARHAWERALTLALGDGSGQVSN